MESIISTFHLDWKLMLAQLVNFAIVAFVLWYFVFKPLSAKMSERTKTIEKSLEEAKQISANLKSSQDEKQQIIKEARQKSEALMQQAAQAAVQERQKSVAAAKAEVKKVVDDGKLQLTAEKEKMLAEVKTDVADLVIAAATKVLEKTVDKKINRELVADALKDIKTKDQK
ncbi:MAG: F0F1 ATP synthase subunit B [Patescibacteria group bacterium]